MIIDNLTNLTKYVALNRSFQTVIDYLKANDLKSMEPGHYPIDGDNIFVNIQEGFGKTKDEAKVECHHEMIDIQIPLTEVETYGYIDITHRDVKGFDAVNDIGFLPDLTPLCYPVCQVGMFAIFFPQDGHAPMIGNTARKIKKAIFKVKI